jgi:hypothetical protein
MGFEYEPHKVSALVMFPGGVPRLGYVVSIGGGLFRRIMEDPTNPPAGAITIPDGFRISSLMRDGLHPVSATRSGPGPFALADGQTVEIAIDGGATTTITLQTDDYVSIGAATADELVSVINRDLPGGISRTVNGGVVVVSSTEDEHGTVDVIGGTATIGFPTELFPGYPHDGPETDLDWCALVSSHDDRLIHCIVIDPTATINQPSPVLASWSAVLSI